MNYLITYSIKNFYNSGYTIKTKLVSNPYIYYINLLQNSTQEKKCIDGNNGQPIVRLEKREYAIINIIEIPARYVKDLKTFLKDKEEQIEETDI